MGKFRLKMIISFLILNSCESIKIVIVILVSISVLPASAFENLNSLETLNIQNNKLTRIPEEVMEPIIDTLRVADIVGKWATSARKKKSGLNWAFTRERSSIDHHLPFSFFLNLFFVVFFFRFVILEYRFFLSFFFLLFIFPNIP